MSEEIAGTLVVWRAVPSEDRVRALRGDGGLIGPGRWHNPGAPVLYTSSTPPLVMLEILANVHSFGRLAPYHVMRVEISGGSVETVPDAELPLNWNDGDWNQATQDYGSTFLAEKRALALAVPCALMPLELRSEASNLMLNPLHPDIQHVRITAAYPLPFDRRLTDWTPSG